MIKGFNLVKIISGGINRMKVNRFFKGFCAALIAAMAVSAAVQAEAVPEGTYLSELTGLPTDAALKDQRPVAVMVDNESTAYPHFGLAEGDVVYELMNSTANGHITRLMVLLKDWDKITQMGNIRSTRCTNVILAGEWNAILCHDGNPFYTNEYFRRDYAQDHISGTFSRVNNGKAWEFTEYILPGDLENNISSRGISRTYDFYHPEEDSHFHFVEYGTETDLTDRANVTALNKVVLPFEHTNSTLVYNEGTGTYDFYCYGSIHQDGEDNQVLTFENVILQKCDYTLYDQNGYMIYNVLAEDMPGYYISNGHAQSIKWDKSVERGLTRYYDLDGNPLAINRGKTYICLVPSEMWDSLVME